MIQMKLYDCVIFDVDGTLVDSESVILSTLQNVIKEELNRETGKCDLLFALGIPSETALQKLGIQDVGRATIRWNEFMREKIGSLTLFDGIARILPVMDDSKTTLGIVTSKPKDALEEILGILKIKKYFKNIICQEDTKCHKPDPAPVLKFIEQYHINVSSAIYVGDTEYDMKSAKSAGIDFGLALWSAKNKDIDADLYFQYPDQIIDIISKKMFRKGSGKDFYECED